MREQVAIKLIRRPLPRIVATNLLREILVRLNSNHGRSGVDRLCLTLVRCASESTALQDLAQGAPPRSWLTRPPICMQIQADLGEGHQGVIQAFEVRTFAAWLALAVTCSLPGSRRIKFLGVSRLDSLYLQVMLTAQHLCLVMELAAGGTLMHHVSDRHTRARPGMSPGLTEDEARYFFTVWRLLWNPVCHQHAAMACERCSEVRTSRSVALLTWRVPCAAIY